MSVISYNLYFIDHFNLPFKTFPIVHEELHGILFKCDFKDLKSSLGLYKSTICVKSQM